MDKLILFDLSNDGHHYGYNSAVMKQLKCQKRFEKLCYYTATTNETIVSDLNQHGIEVENIKDIQQAAGIRGMAARLGVLLRMLKFARHNGYTRVHFFYMDSYIVPLFLLLPVLWMLRLQLTGTLHWYPTRKLKERVFFSLLKLRVMNRIIVHGDLTRTRILSELGRGMGPRVATIYFPSFHNKQFVEGDEAEELQRRLTAYSSPYLLYFGGLRYDKGIDVLLEAAGLMKMNNFTLIVAGQEDHFSNKDIERLVNKGGLDDRVFRDIRYLSDDVVNFYFQQCDAVVLPYRMKYSAQSGPLTEGAARNKLIIGPRHGEVGYSIESYRLGLTFEAENVQDLADKLDTAVIRIMELKAGSHQLNNDYASRLNQQAFGEYYGQFLELG